MSTSTWPVAPPRVIETSDLPRQEYPERIKVLHVITRFWAGAGGNTLLSAVGMDQDRYEVWVAGCPGGDLWEKASEAGVATIEIDRFREVLTPADLLVLVDLVKLMRREKFTVVHTHSTKAGVLGRIAATLTRTPVVVHTFHGFAVHDGMSPWRRRTYLGVERFVRPMTDAFLAVAPRVASEAVQLRLARAGSVRVVPSAVELDQCNPNLRTEARNRLGIAAHDVVVGTTGRIDEQKAPLDFVSMAARVIEEHPATRFVMVGDGPLADEVTKRAANLGVDLTITGYVEDAARLAAAFDVFTICSRYEGLGRALTEAMAAARPVVATCVNGIPDLVEPGATGLLVPPGDPGAAAEQVCWLLTHPVAATAMGHQARERVLNAFDADQMVSAIDDTYRQLLGLPELTVPATIPEASLT